MTDGYNSANPYNKATLSDLQESLGVPQFSGSTGTDWYFVLNGMIVQGGIITIPAGTTTFPFITAFPQQVLGVFLQPTEEHAPGVLATTLSTFDVTYTGATHDCYWWAIGV